MAIEDFTTYTEVDEGNDITVIAAKITFLNLPANVSSYVYKDKDVDHFDGDFTHTLAYTVTGVSAGAGAVHFWGLANDVDNFKALQDAGLSHLRLQTSRTAAAEQTYLVEKDGFDSYSDFANHGSVDDKHWFRVVRDEAVGTYGTLYCYIYNDEEMTDLLDTISVALHSSKKDYRYIYGLSSHDIGSGIEIDGDVENLDLQEAIAGIVPFRRRIEAYN